MKKIIFFTLLLVCGNLFSQTSYPIGCYMSLDELLSKAPSQNYNLLIEERTASDIQFNGGNDFKLISEDKTIKKRILKREIWAISDGKNLYLNGIHHKCQQWYSKVEDEGKYIIFKAAIPNGEAVTAGLLGGAIGGAILAEKRYVYLLDSKSGEISLVKKKNIHEFLSEHNDLLSKYELEEDQKSVDVILNYIKALNR